MKILFNEIAPKMHIFCATRIEGYMFRQHCSSKGGWGRKIFDHQIGGVTKILPRYFRKFMTPLFQRKWWPPDLLKDMSSCLKMHFYCFSLFHIVEDMSISKTCLKYGTKTRFLQYKNRPRPTFNI